ncbi:hypothetical protein F5X99DRAFT_373375, partial [Biscogniauxia marginata]
MSSSYKLGNVNPEPEVAMAPLRTSRFVEHMDRSPAPLDKVELAGRPSPEHFSPPPRTPALDIPQPSPTPYPFRGRNRQEARGKRSIINNSPIAPSSSERAVEDYAIDSTDEIEFEVTNQSIDEALKDVPPPPPPKDPPRETVEFGRDKIRAIPRQDRIRNADSGNLILPNAGPVSTPSLIPQRRGAIRRQRDTRPQVFQRGNAKDVRPSQGLRLNSLPTQNSGRKPATTFEDLLKKGYREH